MDRQAANLAEPLVEPLSRRERELLGLLAKGLTGPEMAEKLTIALSSVRSHLHNLYRKLGVNSKRSALSRARMLGLLATPAASQTPRHNLPMQLTRFFGREAEMAQLKALLGEYRLVTVTGAGGVGKTRLTQRVAEDELNDYEAGVRFVALAPLSDPALLAQEVALALGVREGLSGNIQEELMSFLRERQMLLVLDNCEHLLNACARLADDLLRDCPRLTILASSREPLGVAGEAVFAAASLPFPKPGQPLPLDRLPAFPALGLFVDRARMLKPNYEITSDNAASLAQICARLDGMPLAIEMAAARINLLTAEQLASRLEAALGLLTAGRRTALPRQQTLRATIDWSYELLTQAERLLWQRLSVFAGGCTLEAAEAVCSGEGLEAGGILDGLASLVDKSMVIADRPQGQHARYRLLEVLRQYAQEKLEATGDGGRLRCQHRDHYLQSAKQRWEGDSESQRAVWDARMQVERENLRQALEWSFSCPGEHGDIAAGPALLVALESVWPLSWQELAQWYDRAIAWCQTYAEVSPWLFTILLEQAAGTFAFHDLERALACSQLGVDISRRLGPEGGARLLASLIRLSSVRASLMQLGPAWEHNSEAEAVFSALGPDHYSPKEYLRMKADFAAAKARLANKQSRFDDAKRYAAESIKLFEALGPDWRIFFPWIEMGTAYMELGEYERAREYFSLALHLDDTLTEVYAEFRRAFAWRCLGMVELATNNRETALAYCQAGLRAAKEISARGLVASCLTLAANIYAKEAPLRAARLFGAAQVLYVGLGGPPWEDVSLQTLFPGWPDCAGQAAIVEALAAGQRLTAEQAVNIALGSAT